MPNEFCIVAESTTIAAPITTTPSRAPCATSSRSMRALVRGNGRRTGGATLASSGATTSRAACDIRLKSSHPRYEVNLKALLRGTAHECGVGAEIPAGPRGRVDVLPLEGDRDRPRRRKSILRRLDTEAGR